MKKNRGDRKKLKLQKEALRSLGDMLEQVRGGTYTAAPCGGPTVFGCGGGGGTRKRC